MQGTPTDASKLIIHREFKEKEIDLYIEAFIQIAMIGVDIIKEDKKQKAISKAKKYIDEKPN